MNNFFENVDQVFRDKTDSFTERTPKKYGTIKAFVITFIIFIVSQYLMMIPIHLRSPQFIFHLGILIGVFTLLRSAFNAKFDKVSKAGMVLIVVLAAYLFVGEFLSSPFFHASAYQQQLDVDKDADFYKDNEKVNYQSIPVVDKDSAQRLGDRKMGEIVDYVSQFEVDDEYGQINFNDKPYRVTTISYSDFIKWFTNHRNGLPAYIRVDMVSQESEVVRLDEGMKYSHSDLFFRNINRYVHMHYPTKMFETPTFEINDEGDPYWIAPVYDYDIGFFGGKDVKGAIMVNAINGEHQYYDIDKVPTWVDRVYPAEMVIHQLENWGKYTNGYLNTIFSQKGVLKPTDGYNYIALNDDVYLYTGLTSVSSDASNVGFALVNLRTKESKYYAISGAEEFSAMSSAEGKVQNLKYKATFPILINAGGQPTYFLSLKDSAGLVKKYAFVSVENYQIVSVGDSVAEAEKAYYKLLSENGKVKVDFETKDITGKIGRIQEAVVNGNSHYYFTIEGQSKSFVAPISLNEGLPLLKPGDTVELKYVHDQSQVETVSELTIR